MARIAAFTIVLALALISFTQATVIAERSNPTQTFCPAFRNECDTLINAVNNGLQTVNSKSYCKRNGGKYSTSFTFYCKINGDDFTQQALDNVSNEDTPALQRRSQKVPTINVVIPAGRFADQRKREDRGSFCSSYLSACETECARVTSNPKNVVCRRNSALHYTLACKCANGKMETQHALARTLDNPPSSNEATPSSSDIIATPTLDVPTSAVESIVASATSIADSIANKASSEIASLVSTATSLGASEASSLTSLVDSIATSATGAVGSVIASATSVAGPVATSAASALESAGGEATSEIGSVATSATSVVGSVIDSAVPTSV